MNKFGTWTWFEETGEFHWSSGLCALFNRADDSSRIPLQEVCACLTPDSAHSLQTALQQVSLSGGQFELVCSLQDTQLPVHCIRFCGEYSASSTQPQLHGLAEEIAPLPGQAAAIPDALPAVAAALPFGILMLSSPQRLAWINPLFCDWLQLPQQPVKTALQTRHLFDSPLLDIIEAAFQGTPASLTQAFAQPDGSERLLALELTPLREAAQQAAAQIMSPVTGCLMTATDVTAYHQTIAQLRDHEKRWQMTLESSGDGTWDWYPQSGIEYLSDKLKAIYGYAPEDIGNLPEELDSRTHPDDKLQMELDRLAHFEGKTPGYINEHRVQCKDGSWKWILTRGMVIERDSEGQPLRVVGTHTDISERKQAEVALRESEERLRMALSATHQGLFDMNLHTGIAVVNAEYAHMLGYTLPDFQENRARWYSGLHPDDLERADRAYSDYLNGKTEEYRVEFRQRHANGSWIWVLSVGALAEWDENGNPLRMLGTVLDITERKQSEALIWTQANIDPLTGLPNRRMFYDRLEQDMRRSRRSHLPLAVLFIDLDFFKEVNDTLGHASGDALLIEAAERLRRCVRDSDTVARLGGDEFTIAMPDQHDTLHVEQIARNIISALSSPFMLAEQEIYLSASVGITIYPRDASTLSDLIKHADQAMYAAKDQGRNRFSYFTPNLQIAAQSRLRLSNDLRLAVNEQQLEVFFQPVVDLASGRILKAEALIRWPHAQLGYISPLEFIPIAESTGLIYHIGEQVFKVATYWVRRWRDLVHTDFQISINQSPLEFQNDQGRYADWLQHLRRHQLPGQAITIEITEGLLLDASTKVATRLLEFRDAGIQVAIDDFGTGYSSLSYLQKFDIDYLKIDQSFTRNLTPSSNDLALPEAIIMMAHKLGLSVIAEGVETALQRDLLRQAGCDFAQGYLFSRPLPPEEFEALLLAQQAGRHTG